MFGNSVPEKSKTNSTNLGGKDYEKRSYAVRIHPEFAHPGQDTEALLVKRGGNSDLNFVRIRDQDGNTFTEIKTYVNTHAVRSTIGVTLPWHCIEVSVSGEWVPGSRFYTLTQPSCETPTAIEEITSNSISTFDPSL